MSGHRCRVVNPKERVRIASRTRQYKNTRMPEMCEELFQWWADLSQVCQARIPNGVILAEAQILLEDARAHHEHLIAQGFCPPEYKEPVLNAMWLSRWRRFFALVPRSITCTYKVSYRKKMLHLGV